MKNLTPTPLNTPQEWKNISEELQSQVNFLVDTMKDASNFVVEMFFRDDVLSLIEQNWSHISAQMLKEIIQTLNKAIVLHNKPTLKATIIDSLIKELNEKERVINNIIAIDSIVAVFHDSPTQISTNKQWTDSMQTTPADEISTHHKHEIAATLDNYSYEETIWWPDISTLDIQSESKIERETAFAAIKGSKDLKIRNFKKKLKDEIPGNPDFHHISWISQQIESWSQNMYKRFLLWEKVASLKPKNTMTEITTFILEGFKKNNLTLSPSLKKFTFQTLYLRANNKSSAREAILLQKFVKEHISSQEELWWYIEVLVHKNKFAKNRKRLDAALHFISKLDFFQKDELREKFENL